MSADLIDFPRQAGSDSLDIAAMAEAYAPRVEAFAELRARALAPMRDAGFEAEMVAHRARFAREREGAVVHAFALGAGAMALFVSLVAVWAGASR